MDKILILILSLTFSAINAQHADWLVQYKSHVSINLKASNHSFIKSAEKISDDLNIWRVQTNADCSHFELKSKLSHSKSIKSISPNLPLEKRTREPNDFFYNEQWNLKRIAVNLAWDQTTGGTDLSGNDIVIAILDDGFDLYHEDLRQNYWVNVKEIPEDNIDNDNNGYIDDVLGVNIQNGTGIHAGVKHGTQVSGIMCAKGDNDIGIAGIVWNSKILLISGVSNIAEVIKGMDYLYQLKLKFIMSGGTEGANIVVNNFSGGLNRIFPSDFPSWCEAYDLLGSVGILSVSAVANVNYNVEEEGDMPTLCDSDYLLTVTNTNIADKKVLDAAFGPISVDLGAPGENIISASIGNDYETISGTSASAPHVAGAIGLLYSLPCQQLQNLSESNPSQAALLIRESILSSTEIKETLELTTSGGRLNIFNAMLTLRETCGNPEAIELDFNVVPNRFLAVQNPEFIKVAYSSENLDNHQLTIYDMNGKVIYLTRFTPPLFENGLIEIPTAGIHFSRGFYIVQIRNAITSISHKLLVL